MKTGDDLSIQLWKDLMKSKYKAQAEKIIRSGSCEVDPSFLAFVDVYRGLSLAIEKDYTIYDLGCSYNFQNWYFRNHKKYVAVNPHPDVMIFDNTEFVQSTIQDFLPRKIESKSFAICSAVPDFAAHELVKKYFKNLFIWYPS